MVLGSANLGGAQLLREEVHMAPGAVVVTNSRGQEGSMEVEMANFDSFLPETNSSHLKIGRFTQKETHLPTSNFQVRTVSLSFFLDDRNSHQ